MAEKMTLNQKIEKLDAEVEWFYSDEFKLEEAVDKYKAATKLAKEIEKDRREEFAEAAIESIEQIRKSDAETDRRADIAGMFCKAFEKAVLLVPSEENVGYWVACCLMDQRSIRLEIDNAEELSRTFATIAEILRKFLDEGVGFHAPKITQSANKEEEIA